MQNIFGFELTRIFLLHMGDDLEKIDEYYLAKYKKNIAAHLKDVLKEVCKHGTPSLCQLSFSNNFDCSKRGAKSHSPTTI